MHTWNVYELTPNGRRLLAAVNGANPRQAARAFGRDYMAEHNVRVCIAKSAR